LALAACGGDDGATTTEAPATEAPATAAPTTPATTEAPVATEPETTTTVAAPSLGSVLDVAAEAGQFTTFLAAVEAAGLTDELSGGQITVLAPTDAAFEALGEDAVNALLADPARLVDVLQGHVLPSPQDTELIAIFNNVLAVNGASWDVTADDAGLRIGPATVVVADLAADNGFLHGIDAVLLPAEAPAP
jgi:uncharacterized surface protein with fasciclin (FAS1) repeats